MIFRPATPADGAEMLQLIESHPARGGMQILYTRRPDAYQSYRTECAEAEMTVGVGKEGRLLAQAVCLPRKLYMDGEIQTVGYVTGLHKKDGLVVNFMKMLEQARVRSAADHFFCSILDDNNAVLDLFSKRNLIAPICDYTTYIAAPAALRRRGPSLSVRRADARDAERLLAFYRAEGAGYSYFPHFSDMEAFAGLSVTDFLLVEDGGAIVAACALWNQRAFKQYIALHYSGGYRIAARCNPLLRLLRYPVLPRLNTPANFAYVSFLLWREGDRSAIPALLSAAADAGRGVDFLTIGAVRGSAADDVLRPLRSIKFGSKICRINHRKEDSVPPVKRPPHLECALL